MTIFKNGKSSSIIYTLWFFNIAMENGLFIDDFHIKTSIYKGFSMAILNNQMVNGHVHPFSIMFDVQKFQHL